MRLLGKSAIVLGVAGAMALASMTASEARVRGAAIAAGAAGFAAGAAVGAAAAGPGYYGYSDPGYAYTGDPAYDSYAYAPGYGGGYGYTNYDSSYDYNSNTISPSRERVLEGRDY